MAQQSAKYLKKKKKKKNKKTIKSFSIYVIWKARDTFLRVCAFLLEQVQFEGKWKVDSVFLFVFVVVVFSLLWF